MRNLLEPGHEDGDESGFADFISRLRPYPSPPGFQMALLYAVAGAVGLLAAGIGLAILPTDLEGDGFHAIGASEVEPLLEFLATPSSAFIFLGLMSLVATGIVGMGRRVSDVTGGVLAAITIVGVAAFLWTTVGWLVWGVLFAANLLLWLLVLASIPVAAVLFFRGEAAAAVVTLGVAFVLASVLSQAASGPVPSGGPAANQEAATLPPAKGAESPPVSAETEQQRRTERRQRLRRAGLTQERIALKARMEAEYAAWRHVPFVPPCDGAVRRGEVRDLRGRFADMNLRLWAAVRYVEPGIFRQAAADLERVARERERTLADPTRLYEQEGRCPSGAAAMANSW